MIVGLITTVLLVESYRAMVEAARAGGRAIPELWPVGTEALALAMEVSVLEAKRLGHRAVRRLSWLLLVASVAGREQARACPRRYTALVAAGQPVTGARLAEAAGVSAKAIGPAPPAATTGTWLPGLPSAPPPRRCASRVVQLTGATGGPGKRFDSFVES